MVARFSFQKFLSSFFILVFLFGCASAGKKDQRQLRNLVQAGDLDAAIQKVETLDFYKDEKSRLLQFLEKGMLLHRKGDFESSGLEFQKARDLLRQWYTISLSGKVATFVVNDNSDRYDGLSYEWSLIHFYQSLNFLMLARTSSSEKRSDFLNKARAELVAWNSLQDVLQNQNHEKFFFKRDLSSKLYGGLVHEIIDTSQDRETALILYRQGLDILFKNYNQFPLYNKKAHLFLKNYSKLSKMKKEVIEKKFVEPTSEYTKLYDVLSYKYLSLVWKQRRREYKKRFKELAPSKTVTSKLNLMRKNDKKKRVVVLLHRNLIPEKYASKQYYGLDPNQYDSAGAKIAATVGAVALTFFAINQLGLLPPPGQFSPIGAQFGFESAKLGAQSAAISFELPRINGVSNRDIPSIIIKNGEKVELSETPIVLSPIDQIASQSVIFDSGKKYGKIGTRLALKHLTAIVASYGTYVAMKGSNKGNDYLAKSAAVIQYAAASRGIAASEKADLRYWSTLPQDVLLAEFYLDPGQYSIEIKQGEILKKSLSLDIEKRSFEFLSVID